MDGSEAIRLLVCPGEKSTEPSKCRPCVFLSRLETEVRSTALPRIRFHVIRHSHATHILASGVPYIKSQRKGLGHSKVAIKLDLSSHVLPNMQSVAAALLDAQLEAAKKREKKGYQNDSSLLI